MEVHRQTHAIAACHRKPSPCVDLVSASAFIDEDADNDENIVNRELTFETPPAPTQTTTLSSGRLGTQNVCTECNVMPTTHTCRKCKKYVCDMCCYSNRELEMVWWCTLCFDNESLTTQRIIREGIYDSADDGEE